MKKYFRIKDELGYFVDRYSFGELDGQWWYISHTGYLMGGILHGNRDTAEELLEYLTHMSKRLGLNKEFEIVEVSMGDLDFDNKKIVKKIDLQRQVVTKFNPVHIK